MKAFKWLGKWFVVIPGLIIAGLVYSHLATRDQAMTQYVKVGTEVGYGLGVALFTVPVLISQGVTAKADIEASGAGNPAASAPANDLVPGLNAKGTKCSKKQDAAGKCQYLKGVTVP